MNLNKVIPHWIILMVKKAIKDGSSKIYEQPQIILKPAKDHVSTDHLRNKEIANLVAKIVRLGNKRGRPSKREKEVDYAA